MDKGGRSTRFNMRVPPRWMALVRAEAQRLGISMADCVILAVNERFQDVSPARPMTAGTRPRGESQAIPGYPGGLPADNRATRSNRSFSMASVEQLKTRISKVAERIQKKQEELSGLRTQQKDLRTQLADARKSKGAKAKAK